MKDGYDYSGERFLLELYKDAIKNNDVINNNSLKTNPLDNLRIYLDRLDRISSKASRMNHINLLKNLFYNKYIIKEEEIDESKLHGDTKDNIIEKQKESMDKWLDYLLSENNAYPMWTKYWAFQGMIKMGVLDNDLERYNRRTNNTIKPFVECNPEVLAHAIQLIIKYNHQKVLDDKKVERLVSTGSFTKIYGTLLIDYNKKKKEMEFSTDGEWIKYSQGSMEDAEKLYDSLQGYNTGWCTAGSFDVCKHQLCGPYGSAQNGGDFYVYYTINKNNEYKIPKIAIRMNGDTIIGEIRGVKDNQCLDEELEPVVEEKINGMNIHEKSKQKALKKCSNLKLLTKINRKVYNNEQLDNSEIMFIYNALNSIYDEIGYGWEPDSRIKNIAIRRAKQGYGYRDAEIYGLHLESYLREYFKYFPDGVKTKKMCIDTLRNAPALIKYVPKNILDEDIYNEAGAYSFEVLPLDSEFARQFAFKLVEEEPELLARIPYNIGNYKVLAIYALSHLNYAAKINLLSKQSPDYKDIIIELLRKGIVRLRDLSKEDLDGDMCIAAVFNDGRYLSDVPEKFKDRDICELALKTHGYALKYVPEEFVDRDMCLLAVQNDGVALELVPNEYKDKKMCMTAFENHPLALAGFPPEFIDESICVNAVQRRGTAIKYIPENYLTTDLYLMAVSNSKAYALFSIPENVDNYTQIWQTAVKTNPEIVFDIPLSNKNYLEMSFLAGLLNPDCVCFIKDRNASNYVKETLSKYDNKVPEEVAMSIFDDYFGQNDNKKVI